MKLHTSAFRFIGGYAEEEYIGGCAEEAQSDLSS